MSSQPENGEEKQPGMEEKRRNSHDPGNDKEETSSGLMASRLFRLLAGLVLAGSVFLPFMSNEGYSLFSRIMDMLPNIVPTFIHFFISPPEVVPRTVPIAYILIIAGFVFLVMGAIYSLAKGRKGGVMAVVGIAMEITAFSLLAGNFSPYLLILGGPGLYMAWAGSITAILSKGLN